MQQRRRPPTFSFLHEKLMPKRRDDTKKYSGRTIAEKVIIRKENT
jgi:hypothetical protein